MQHGRTHSSEPSRATNVSAPSLGPQRRVLLRLTHPSSHTQLIHAPPAGCVIAAFDANPCSRVSSILSACRCQSSVPSASRRARRDGTQWRTRTPRASSKPAVGRSATFYGDAQKSRVGHFNTLPCDELAAPDLDTSLARCPDPRSRRSSRVAGRGTAACESAGNRIF